MELYSRTKSVWLLAMLILFFCQATQAAVVYRTESNASSAPDLQAYDTDTGSWSILAALPSGNYTQLATSSDTVYALPSDGNIYAYDGGLNTWNLVMAGPPASIGRRNISMLETHNGEFYWGDDATSTLHYTKNGVWTSIQTPSSLSSAADFDTTTGILYIRVYGQLGHMAFDTNTETFLAGCTDTTNVGENSRAGVFFGGNFYARTWSGNLIATDVQTCVASDTSVGLQTEHSSTAVDTAGNIFLNGFSSSVNTLEVFSTTGNQVSLLPDAPALNVGGGHATLAVLGAASIGGGPDEALPVPVNSVWMLILMILGMGFIVSRSTYLKQR